MTYMARSLKLTLLLFLCIVLSGKSNAQITETEDYIHFVAGNGINRLVMSDSYAYFVTDAGLYKLNLSSEEFEFLYSNVELNELPRMSNLIGWNAAVDSEGILWFASDEGLGVINEQGKFEILCELPFTDYSISAFAIDRQDNVWLGFNKNPIGTDPSSNALARFSGCEWEFIDVGFTELTVYDLEFDAENNPMFVADDGFFYKFNGVSFDATSVIGDNNISIGSNDFIAITNSWYSGTLMSYYDGEWSTLNGNFYKHAAFDNDNLLWLEDSDGALYNLSNGDETPIKIIDGPVGNNPDEDRATRTFGFDKNDKLWVGKENGLFSFDKNELEWKMWTLYETDFNGLTIDDIEAEKDSIWILSHEKLYRFNDFNFVNAQYLGDNLKFIQYDHFRKGLWAYGNDHAFFFQENNVISYSMKSIDPFNLGEIEGIESDDLGNIWFDTVFGLVHYSSQNTWKFYKHGVDIPLVFGYSYSIISPKKDGSLWLLLNKAGYGYGYVAPSLHIISNGQVQDVTEKYDIPNEHFKSFIATQDSTIVLISPYGINIFDGESEPIIIDSQFDLRNDWIAVNDSTLFNCSYFGFYVLNLSGELKEHDFTALGLTSNRAYPASLTSDNELVLSNLDVLLLKDPLSLVTKSIEIPDEGKPSTNYLTIYPNPSTGSVNLDIENIEDCKDCKILIFDAQGKLFKKYDSFDSSVILPNMKGGMYFLSLVQGNKFLETSKFIVH